MAWSGIDLVLILTSKLQNKRHENKNRTFFPYPRFDLNI